MSKKEQSSVADAVEQYLANDEITPINTSFDDNFNNDEIATIINPERLNQLLTSCDEFLTQTQNDMAQFDETLDFKPFEQKKDV